MEIDARNRTALRGSGLISSMSCGGNGIPKVKSRYWFWVTDDPDPFRRS
jgi:hypothetical protein